MKNDGHVPFGRNQNIAFVIVSKPARQQRNSLSCKVIYTDIFGVTFLNPFVARLNNL